MQIVVPQYVELNHKFEDQGCIICQQFFCWVVLHLLPVTVKLSVHDLTETGTHEKLHTINVS